MSDPLNLPIVAVTLMEDRANVQRRGRLELEAGSHRFSVTGVSPIVADKTLHGKLSCASGKILDLQIQRRPRPFDQQPDPQSQELWGRIEVQKELAQAEEREMNRLSTMISHYSLLARQWGEETSREASCGPAELERWKANWVSLRQRVCKLTDRLGAARVRWDQEQRQLNDLTRQHRLLQSPSSESEAVLELTLVLEQAEAFELTVEYCVPNACWRPCHVAQWVGSNLHLRSQACLWQNTGEEWSQALLSFSTERATLGTEAPPLQPDLLYLIPKQKKTVVTTLEQTVHQVEERASGVPGIDAGGATLCYTATEPVTVPSDGRPHRVPLFEFETPLREEKVVMPELRREVFVRTKSENAAPGPILAGPVDLIKSCGLVGRGYLEYAAAGETFSVNWGPHPELRCHREQQTEAEEKSLISGWRSKEHSVEIHLSNLGPHGHSLEVLERLPVSELKGVKIEQDLGKTTNRTVQDKNGFLSFPVDLSPFGRKTLTLAYLVSAQKDVQGV